MLSVGCQDISFLLRITVKIVKYMHIIVPILLIVLIIFDLLKVLTGSADEKAKNEAFSKAVRRFIYAAIVFLIPTIINIVFKKIDGVTNNDTPATSAGATSWMSCWTQEYNK